MNSTDIGIQLLAYSAVDPEQLIGNINGRMIPKFLEQLNNFGVGTFDIPINDPKIRKKPQLLAYRNIIRIQIGEVFVGAFRIEQITTDFISEGEQSTEIYHITGKSLKFTFDDAVVYPYKQLRATSRDKRYFSWASAEQGAWYKREDWPLATRYVAAQQPSPEGDWVGSPKDWPEAAMAATWIGSGPFVKPMPFGDLYFRRTISYGAGTYRFYAAADDWFELYLDGELLLSTDIRASSLTATSKIDVVVSEGDHVLAFHTRNTIYGPTALIAAIFFVENDGTETLITHSRFGEWRVLAYPAKAPGWSTGEILLKLMDEARQRGVNFPNWLTPTFTATSDSYGNSWQNELDWSFEVGESLSSVINKLEEFACDIWIDYQNLTINMAPQRGVDRTTTKYINGVRKDPVIFRKARDIRKGSSVGLSRIKNALVAKADEEWMTDEQDVVDVQSVAQYGRIEGSIKSPASKDVAKALLKQVFNNQGNPEESAAYDIVAIKHRPFIDYNTGDIVLAPDKSGQLVPRRIVSISVEVTDENVLYTIEFDTILQLRQERLNRALEVGIPLGVPYFNA